MTTDRRFQIDGGGWRRWNGGLAWRVELHEAGARLFVEGEDRAPRTVGAPRTMATLWHDYGAQILAAAERFELPIHLIASMLAVEAVKVLGTFHFNPASVREEPGYKSDTATPGRVSSGLMQTLLRTADSMAERFELFETPIRRRQLFVPRVSILLGAAYLRYLGDREETLDPIYLCGAYNAGDAKSSSKNPFGILAYGADRPVKMIRYWNDLDATGLVPPDPNLKRCYG